MQKFVGLAFIVVVGSLIGMPRYAASQTCTQTVSPGTSVAMTIAAAVPGSTVCLNSGSYGSVTVSGAVKNPRVTVRSTTGQGASLSLNVSGGTNGLTVSSVTVTGGSIQGGTTRNITVQNSNFTNQYYIITTDFNNNNILFDNNTHINIDRTGPKDGRLAIYWPNGPGSQPCGVTITNSRFENLPPYHTGNSDGVEIGANGVVFGPGNIIRGIQQNGFDPEHTDGMQLYGQRNTLITGNLFIDNEVNIGSYDGGNTETITHNVFRLGNGVRHPNNIYLSIGPNGTITHNTFDGIIVRIGSKPTHTPNSNHLFQDNILYNNTDLSFDTGNNPSCIGCVANNNLVDTQSSIATTSWTPTATISGLPVFVGGSSPTTYGGYALVSGSIGKGAAVSPPGTDLGPVFDGASNSAPPAPTNLIISMILAPGKYAYGSVRAVISRLSRPQRISAISEALHSRVVATRVRD